MDIWDLRERFGLDTFFETGTGDGEGLEYALSVPFKRWISVEIMEKTASNVREKMAGKWVEVWQGASINHVLNFAKNRSGQKALWWVDAHFPGVDTGLNDHDANAFRGRAIEMPASAELEAIMDSGGWQNDVFLIDDAFFFRAGAAPDMDRDACVPAWTKKALGSLEPWLANMEKTHDITVDPRDTGIIIVTPRLTGV